MNVWDWHYRVFFDERLRAEVDKWANTLTDYEAKICRETVDFYTSFYTFGVLFDLVCEKPEICGRYLDIAESRLNQLLVTPSLLVPHYENKIESSGFSCNQKDRLLTILEASKSGKEIRDRYWEYLRCLMGCDFDRLHDILSQEQYSKYLRLPRQRYVHTEHRALFDEFFAEVTQNPTLLNWFGQCAIDDFDIEIKEGTCYGEWWDRQLADAEKDKLILYTSDAKVKREDYLYTIIHETYPGHGHFYNYVRNDNMQIDHGANMLVEGWATYCEWHSLPSSYVDVVRHNGIVCLHNSCYKSLEEISRIIWLNKKASRIPFKKAIPSLIYATQYIGFMESYYLGALWIENAIDVRRRFTPEQFLSQLRNRNKGEFFRLWQ